MKTKFQNKSNHKSDSVYGAYNPGKTGKLEESIEHR